MKTSAFWSAIVLLLNFCVAAFAVEVNKIDPPFWYSGMKNTELQLLVYGEGIANATVELAGAEAKISKVVKPDSKDYLFVYLDLTNTNPGKLNLTFKDGKKKKVVDYEIKPRTNNRLNDKSFTNEDVLYLIMPDRFANGDPANDKVKALKFDVGVDRSDPNARHGGDLKGIQDHLDYLEDLGVTALWFNPVLENDMEGGSYHGYASTDYYKIDPRFGSNQQYVQLISEVHKRGMKVVMDMIFNHCGTNHPWFLKPPFKDWFNAMPSDKQPYVQTNHAKETYFDMYRSDKDFFEMTDGWFVPSMPDLNQRNPHLATYLIQNSIFWVEYSGIDGIRQDTHPYADFNMMSHWCAAVEKEYPGYNIVGEAWIGQTIGSAYWQKGEAFKKTAETNLPSVMDFRLQGIATDAFTEETEWGKGFDRVYDLLTYDFVYPDVSHLLRFLENHDTDRFLRQAPKDLNAFKQGYLFLLTVPGIPQIYYGSEILMSGTKEGSDGYIRLDFPGGWAGDTRDAFKSSGRTTDENVAFDFMKKILKWRKGNEVITKGTMKHFIPRAGVYTYVRSYQGKNIMIMMNGTSKALEVDPATYKEVYGSSTSGKDILSGEEVLFTQTIHFAPRDIKIVEF